MKNFETYGIHTRLYYLIKKNNKIDWQKREEYLKTKYNLTQEEINLIGSCDIEKYFSKYGVEYKDILIEKMKKEEKKNKLLFSQLLSLY